MVREIEDVNEFLEILTKNDNKLIVIDFYATWCGPCKKIAPVLDTWATTYDRALFYKINCDRPETEDIVSDCKVQSLPTFCFFINGRFIYKTIGANQQILETLIVKLTENDFMNEIINTKNDAELDTFVKKLHQLIKQ